MNNYIAANYPVGNQPNSRAYYFLISTAFAIGSTATGTIEQPSTYARVGMWISLFIGVNLWLWPSYETEDRALQKKLEHLWLFLVESREKHLDVHYIHVRWIFARLLLAIEWLFPSQPGYVTAIATMAHFALAAFLVDDLFLYVRYTIPEVKGAPSNATYMLIEFICILWCIIGYFSSKSTAKRAIQSLCVLGSVLLTSSIVVVASSRLPDGIRLNWIGIVLFGVILFYALAAFVVVATTFNLCMVVAFKKHLARAVTSQSSSDFYFEALVAAGIPIISVGLIRSLQRMLASAAFPSWVRQDLPEALSYFEDMTFSVVIVPQMVFFLFLSLVLHHLIRPYIERLAYQPQKHGVGAIKASFQVLGSALIGAFFQSPVNVLGYLAEKLTS